SFELVAADDLRCHRHILELLHTTGRSDHQLRQGNGTRRETHANRCIRVGGNGDRLCCEAEVLDHQLVRTDRQHETPYTIRIRDRADSMTRGTHLGTRDRLCGASFDDTAVQHDALLLVVTVEGALLRTD